MGVEDRTKAERAMMGRLGALEKRNRTMPSEADQAEIAVLRAKLAGAQAARARDQVGVAAQTAEQEYRRAGEAAHKALTPDQINALAVLLAEAVPGCERRSA